MNVDRKAAFAHASHIISLTGHTGILPWDSQHFGFRVARIKGPGLGEPELRQACFVARRKSIRLVYWAADPRVEVSQSILEEFRRPARGPRRRPFENRWSRLSPTPIAWMFRPHRRASQERARCRICFGCAIAAGGYSRFGAIHGSPGNRFGVFMNSGSIVVFRASWPMSCLVAGRGTDLDLPVGLVTLSLTDGKVRSA